MGYYNYKKTKYCYFLNKYVEILIIMCYYILCINLFIFGWCLNWVKVYLIKKSLIVVNIAQTHKSAQP